MVQTASGFGNYANVYITAGSIPLKDEKRPVFSDDITNTDKLDYYREDPEIMRLQYVMLERTPQTNKWCQKHDNAVGTSGVILTKSILGSAGLQPKLVNEEDKAWINHYLKAIKYDMIIQRAVEDNITFAESIHYKDYVEGVGVIPRWLDYITLHPIKNNYTGARKWIQVADIDVFLPKNNGKAWEKYEPPLDLWHSVPSASNLPSTKLHKSHVMEEDVVNFQLFTSPPIVPVIEVIIWKKWMQHDARLGGQKYATPLIDAEVVLPEHLEINDEETSFLMDRIAEDINRLMNFGVLAHPEGVKLQAIHQQGQVFNFTQYLEYADKQIHKAILLPVNLIESTGSELATSRTTKDIQTVVVESLRNKFKALFKDLILESAEFVGRQLEDFDLEFSEEDKQQRLTHNEEITAILQLYDRGIMKDENEVRAYMGKFGMELPLLTDEELNGNGIPEFGNTEPNSLESSMDQDVYASFTQDRGEVNAKNPDKRIQANNQ